MKRLPVTVAALLTVFATSGVAYLVPNEVFTDLEIPEEGDGAAATDNEENPFDMAEPPVGEESVPEETTEPERQEEEETVAPPMFFRSGEMIETGTTPPPPETQQNIFEEPEPVVTEEEVPAGSPEGAPEETPVEDTAAPVEEAATEEAADEEAATKKSAPKQSLVIRLMDKLKYLIAALGLGVGGGVYFLTKKKPAAPKTQAAAPQGESLAVPAGSPGPQAVEETSKRLEHALSAMSEQAQPPEPSAPPTTGGTNVQ